MRIVFISDTHNYDITDAILDGDMIVHSGDATGMGTLTEISKFLTWYGELPHTYKVFVAGNHDWLFERDHSLGKSMCEYNGITYLSDSEATLGGLRIYGTPWQKYFCNWAFNLEEEDLFEKFQHIPYGLDILVSHTPPLGILDESAHDGKLFNIGSRDLMGMVNQTKPRIHCFGHAHGGYGQIRKNDTLFINASTCNPKYQPSNLPIIVDL